MGKMIRYALTCDRNHEFESWFQSAEAFDRLHAAGRVTCVTCGSAAVAKALMAPALRHDASAADRPLSTPSGDVEQALATLRLQIEENSDYVGLDFATEARAMHEGDRPLRAIHGEARADVARKLMEDGVPVTPLPFLPARKVN